MSARIEDIVGRLHGLHPRLIDLSLGRLQELLGKLGHPEQRLPPVIHVGGTNGKGHLIALPLVVGTPGKPLPRAFGSNYDAYATASLDAIKFSVSPSNPAWQALDQPSDRWGWTITPTQSGRQAVLFAVDVRWRPRLSGKAAPPVQDRRIWESDPQYIQVNEPPITTGQIQISTVLSGALATGVAALLTALVAKLLPSRSGG